LGRERRRLAGRSRKDSGRKIREELGQGDEGRKVRKLREGRGQEMRRGRWQTEAAGK
jgi:hypothetical protein